MNPPHILSVEDDDLQYEIYEEALASYRLTRALNGSEALAKVPADPPSLLVLDHVLAEGELGLEFLPEFKEPRAYLALGRGALGSGRLRSEAFTAARLEEQLTAVADDFVRRRQMLVVDRTQGTVSLTPIVSWREAEFVAAYDPGAEGPFAQRSPIERAIVAFVMPRLLPLEKEFLRQNGFRMVFHDFDWRLNDLTGGRPD